MPSAFIGVRRVNGENPGKLKEMAAWGRLLGSHSQTRAVYSQLPRLTLATQAPFHTELRKTLIKFQSTGGMVDEGEAVCTGFL